jgi:hypothetical protein
MLGPGLMESLNFNMHGGGATNDFGIRVAYIGVLVPEPGCLAMLAAIAVAGLLYKRRAAASIV